MPLSWSLLEVTDIEGNKVTTLKIKNVNGPIGIRTLCHSLISKLHSVCKNQIGKPSMDA